MAAEIPGTTGQLASKGGALAAKPCPACGAANNPGMNFCKQCGGSLKAPAPAPAPAEAAASVKILCGACGGRTPQGFKFCQHCGQPLPSEAAPAFVAPAPVVDDAAVAKTMMATDGQFDVGSLPSPAAVVQAAASVTPAAGMPPASLPVAVPAPRVAPAAPAPRPAPAAPLDLPPPLSEALSAGPAAIDLPPPLSEFPPPLSERPPIADAAVEAATPAAADPIAPEGLADVDMGAATMGPGANLRPPFENPSEAPAPVLANLVSLERDGSDGDVFEIRDNVVDVGRSEGALVFGEDPYLSERHCRFQLKDGNWSLVDLESVNGVYRRVQKHELIDGDQILIGKQMLCFQTLGAAETDLGAAYENGVMVFGSPTRAPWARLRQQTVAGITRDIYHLNSSEVTLGREEGDFVFSDDEFMSRRHLKIAWDGKKADLEDLGSSNGTFVLVRKIRSLESGEVVRVGDQLLRFELA